MGDIKENLRNRREAIGMSRAALARHLGTDEGAIKRWETRNAPPAEILNHIATALGFSVAELLGITPLGLDLSGEWHAVWQTTRDGIPTLNRHVLTAKHAGEFVYLTADGDYDWVADFRLQGSQLVGPYQAVDQSRNERGVMCLTINHHGGAAAIGHWSGSWSDGINGVGFGVIARDEQRADRLMKLLMDQDSLLITEWPREA
jgi:transcriptional regulator with XRE-family HTH domain